MFTIQVIAMRMRTVLKFKMQEHIVSMSLTFLVDDFQQPMKLNISIAIIARTHFSQ